LTTSGAGPYCAIMNFAFSEEQEMLRRTVAEFLATECPPAFVRKMMEHETAHSDELWKKLASLGWLGLAIPERFGGSGRSLLDLVIVLEEAGKALLPGAYFSTAVLGASTLAYAASATQKRRWLPGIADGSTTVTVAFLEPSLRYDSAGIRLEAKRRGTGWVLRGEKSFVLDAGVADWILVAARTARAAADAGITLFAVEREAPGLEITPLRGIDRTRRQSNLRFEGVIVPEKQVLGRPGAGWRPLARALSHAVTGLCAETVGVAAGALERAVDYAKQRRQFGRPIGSFQAVKHKCVDMLVAVENARSLSYWAAWAVAHADREAPKALAMAKAYTSDMGKTVTGEAIQVHGGVGFTWEHDVHLYYRRALANEAMFGSAPHHREAVARHLAL
jgi:alkylation response protein AidB-like acyl-CoA dehydrogenase